MKLWMTAAALALSTQLAWAETETAKPAAPVKDYTMVEVNGEAIVYSKIQSIWDGLFPGDGEAPDIRSFGDAMQDNVVRGVVSERLMLKEAEASNLASRKEVQEKLEAMRRQVLVQEHLRLRNVEIDEKEIRKRYDELVARLSGREEIHASHILVETEEEAKEIAKELKKDNASFALLAKQKSADVGSAAGGGDLGYFTAEQMVPEFAKAAFDLDKGEISAPVKSPFGWHLIKLHDKRDKPVPPYEQAKDGIKEQLRAQANQSYIRKLLEDADITYYEADGSKRNFPIEADATTSVSE